MKLSKLTLGRLLELLGLRKLPTQPPVTVPQIGMIHIMAPAGAHLKVVGAQTREADVPESGVVQFDELPLGAYVLTASKDGFVTSTTNVTCPATIQLVMVPSRRMPAGLVRAAGRHFVDDNGSFYPLGHTFFWGLRGWHAGGDERERTKQNIDWIAAQNCDYVRVLGQVSWSGLETRDDWSDYEQTLADFIDYCYSKGLRVQVTMVGGGKYDVDTLSDKVIRVIAPRKEKLFLVEVCNEWFNGNWNYDEAKLIAIGKKIKDATDVLVGLSAPDNNLDILPANDAWVAKGGPNVGLAHFDRSDIEPEWKWHHVRKPWEARGPKYPSSSNEPGGPRSSVAQYEEAIHLVMARATGILCGWDAYVFHNGAGIYGVPRPEDGGRPANVWEIPGIEDTLRVVRHLDKLLPDNASDGNLTRGGLGGHPFASDKFVGDDGRGCVRDYAITTADGFWQVLLGIKDYAMMTPNGNYDLQFINPLTGDVVRTESVTAGQAIRVEPMASITDSRGMGAFIVRGTHR